jgi:hypothetical protein
MGRLFLLFVHVVAFAVALGCVLREDAKLLSVHPLDAGSLRTAARLVRCALIVLWVSGAALVMVDTGGNLSLVADSAKLLAKLTVVATLTLNGVALHYLAFPALFGTVRSRQVAAAIAAILGSVSATSWLWATLLGILHGTPKGWSYPEIVLPYFGTLAVAAAGALIVVRPRIVRKLQVAHD